MAITNEQVNDATLDEILASFREAARDNRDQGDLFERLIANYLVTDPQYNFSDVWLWSEWQNRWGMDTGIDLVAREAATGHYWAIQCKFYLPENQIAKKDIDSFLSASGKRFATDEGDQAFSNRLIVSTTNKWGKNAEEALVNQQPPVERLSIEDLEDSPVDWSQFRLDQPDAMQLRPQKTLRPDQQISLGNVLSGFENHDRGKLIMACGTGKTFVALRITEQMVPPGGRILFLAPSISLVSQSLREWTADADTPFNPLVVCSDTKVGKDDEDARAHDLPYPATTDATRLARTAEALATYEARQATPKHTVVFSTYQSIQVVGDAQKQGLGEFDLIICDEAHRTTGLTRKGEDDSDFVKVHSNQHVAGAKRLYMTATPRIFAEASKTKAADKEAVLYSMDDEARYGPQFHRLGFGEAVRKGLLCDYRVLLVAVDETKMAHVLNAYSASLGDGDEPPKAVDSRFVSKIFGSWKGLAKKDVRLVGEAGEEEAPDYDRQPMRRAIAFSSSIKNSKMLTDTFPGLIDLYKRETGREDTLTCAFDHVDGSMNALVRQTKLKWLKGEDRNGADDHCRVLSNARCLSEGIDVPALDGVVFFDTRESVVDIVQSVGRVMRKPKAGSGHNKQYGYIILPVGIPTDKLASYDKYISSDPRFKGIWKVIKALRAHDESLVDEAEFRSKIQIIDGSDDKGDGDSGSGEQIEIDLPPLPIGDISEAVYAAIPKKLGDTSYWHDWAKDVARIAQNVIARIQALIEKPEPRKAFNDFIASLRKNLNPSVDEQAAVEMLAQHMVTRPVFEALFEREANRDGNPVSRAMERVVAHMDRHGIEGETNELDAFYESIRERAALAKSEKSRQELIRSLYDSFFATAFADVAKNLGIVYTPVEIVDFILHSANDALQAHFGRRLTDKQVHLLDPFTGTGTFITRLLQNSDLIQDADLAHKYHHELHANEIVLLAYYVAGVNIESAYRARSGADENTGFPGLVLTDTFQMSEAKDVIDQLVLPENSERIQNQRDKPIKVIVGNPPYSVAQGGAKYDYLDGRIGQTYAKYSQATNKNSLYDSYIRAIRWASDRIEGEGIVAFVTNGGWLDGNTTAGLRKCLADEFSAVYVFDLRGNQRTSGELSRREGGKVFGSGSRAPIAITLLVKTPAHTGPATIHYHDIGDYLSTQEKLDRIADYGCYQDMDWQTIQPNTHHDWLNQRSEDFYTLKALYGEDSAVFSLRSGGNKSNRDPWVYNGSRERLSEMVKRQLTFYEAEMERMAPELAQIGSQKAREVYVKQHAREDATHIKWTRGLHQNAARQRLEPFDPDKVVRAQYRPFVRQQFYSGLLLNEMTYRIPSIFPTATHENRVIQIIGTGESNPFSCLMSDCIPDLHVLAGGQCHPLYWYEKQEPNKNGGLFDSEDDEHGYVRHEAITDDALADFQSHYGDDSITKEGIFYYTYGVLHSPAYRTKYAADLRKESARVPYAPDFHAFRVAGEKLAELHVGYESVEPYPLREQSDKLNLDADDFYHVSKMKHPGKRGSEDRSVIVVNDHLRLTGIPEKAHEYVVNGKSALAWVMERYQYTKDKDSGIVNDPNEWSDDPTYIVELVKKVVTVSVETMQIVEGLPEIDLDGTPLNKNVSRGKQ